MAAPRKYPDELRERAVREVRTTGRPIAHVAKDLGIHKEALRGWVRQAEADPVSPRVPSSTSAVALTG
ncbi:transposase [Streptomyces sp. NPDC058442]|uniref:transposase n=1 Tax=Streptomyces sp. NPDC058442 TaxID=3346503 RepID=UPI00365A5AAF